MKIEEGQEALFHTVELTELQSLIFPLESWNFLPFSPAAAHKTNTFFILFFSSYRKVIGSRSQIFTLLNCPSFLPASVYIFSTQLTQVMSQFYEGCFNKVFQGRKKNLILFLFSELSFRKMREMQLQLKHCMAVSCSLQFTLIYYRGESEKKILFYFL